MGFCRTARDSSLTRWGVAAATLGCIALVAAISFLSPPALALAVRGLLGFALSAGLLYLVVANRDVFSDPRRRRLAVFGIVGIPFVVAYMLLELVGSGP